MGAWSPTILGNDTSCEVHDRFLELYDLGENPEVIAEIILEEQSENLQYDRTNVWLGLALASWKCKVLTSETLAEIKRIVDSKEDILFNKDLEADEHFLKKRQKNLDSFLCKISIDKEKARTRKKIPIIVESIYLPGMCLTYKNANKKYIGIFITKSEHYRNKGEIKFFFMDFESDKLPSIDLFINSKLFGLTKLGEEWGNYDYSGNVTDISYDKNTKEAFLNLIQNEFPLVGTLTRLDETKIINNYKGKTLDLTNFVTTIEKIDSIRIEGKEKQQLSDLTLGNLLERIGIKD